MQRIRLELTGEICSLLEVTAHCIIKNVLLGKYLLYVICTRKHSEKNPTYLISKEFIGENFSKCFIPSDSSLHRQRSNW